MAKYYGSKSRACAKLLVPYSCDLLIFGHLLNYYYLFVSGNARSSRTSHAVTPSEGGHVQQCGPARPYGRLCYAGTVSPPISVLSKTLRCRCVSGTLDAPALVIGMYSVADPGCVSRIRIFFIPDPNFSISDPGSRGQKGTGSETATLGMYIICTNFVLKVGVGGSWPEIVTGWQQCFISGSELSWLFWIYWILIRIL